MCASRDYEIEGSYEVVIVPVGVSEDDNTKAKAYAKVFKPQDEKAEASIKRLKNPRRKSSDFQDPEAQVRFWKWFDNSNLSKTVDMAVIFNVSHTTAGKYVDSPEEMTEWAADRLKDAIGVDMYNAIITGYVPKESKAVRDKKERLIKQIAEELEVVPLQDVETVKDMIDGLYCSCTGKSRVTVRNRRK